MDIKQMDQGLLKRNPSMTREEFSTHWFTKHAPLIVPFFLDLSVQHYEQVRSPFYHPSSVSHLFISRDQNRYMALSPPPHIPSLP
jgi:hypothetical protein